MHSEIGMGVSVRNIQIPIITTDYVRNRVHTYVFVLVCPPSVCSSDLTAVLAGDPKR